MENALRVLFAISAFFVVLPAAATLIMRTRGRFADEPRSNSSTLVACAVGSVVLTALLKFASAGWGFIPEVMSLIVITAPIGHIWTNVLAAKAGKPRPPAALLIISDVLFLCTSFFRVDAGDGPSWMGINTREPPPAWVMPFVKYGVLYNLALYVPVVLSWLLMFAILIRAPKTVDCRGGASAAARSRE